MTRTICEQCSTPFFQVVHRVLHGRDMVEATPSMLCITYIPASLSSGGGHSLEEFANLLPGACRTPGYCRTGQDPRTVSITTLQQQIPAVERFRPYERIAGYPSWKMENRTNCARRCIPSAPVYRESVPNLKQPETFEKMFVALEACRQDSSKNDLQRRSNVTTTVRLRRGKCLSLKKPLIVLQTQIQRFEPKVIDSHRRFIIKTFAYLVDSLYRPSTIRSVASVSSKDGISDNSILLLFLCRPANVTLIFFRDIRLSLDALHVTMYEEIESTGHDIDGHWVQNLAVATGALDSLREDINV